MTASYVDKMLIGVSYILRLLIVIEAVTAAWNKNVLLVFLALSILVLTFIPSFIKRNYKITLPIELEFLVVIFISFSLFLGEVHGYYTKFWWWDVMLHSVSSVVFSFIGFLIVYLLYLQKKVRMKPAFVALFSFCFAVAIGTLWEIIEFGLDYAFGWAMQKSGLIDTMWDLIVDAICAFFVSIAGYFYVRKKRSSLFFRHAVERFIAANPKMFLRR